MRWCVSVGAVLVAGAIVGGDVAGIAAPSPKSRFADTKHNVAAVNVELVIAVDVSYSMDMDELAIQREGYAQAIVSKDFLQALRAGPGSKVAVTYFEWSMSGDEKLIIPWRVIDGPESADAVSAEIMKTPVRRGSSTSISGAINFAVQLFEENPYRGLRRVIDISGDGPNNNGAPVTGARDAALEKGIVINGLVILSDSQLLFNAEHTNPPGGLESDLRPPSQQVDGMARLCYSSEKPRDKVGASRPLRNGVAECPQSPEQGRPIDQVHGRAVQDGLEPHIVLRAHDEVEVDGGDLMTDGTIHELLDAVEDLIGGQQVERDSRKARPGRQLLDSFQVSTPRGTSPRPKKSSRSVAGRARSSNDRCSRGRARRGRQTNSPTAR